MHNALYYFIISYPQDEQNPPCPQGSKIESDTFSKHTMQILLDSDALLDIIVLVSKSEII